MENKETRNGSGLQRKPLLTYTYNFDMFGITSCIFMCFVRLPFIEKEWLQIKQWNLIPATQFNICLSRMYLVLKYLSHPAHWSLSCGECTVWWALRSFLCAKAFSHLSHLNAFSYKDNTIEYTTPDKSNKELMNNQTSYLCVRKFMAHTVSLWLESPWTNFAGVTWFVVMCQSNVIT